MKKYLKFLNACKLYSQQQLLLLIFFYLTKNKTLFLLYCKKALYLCLYFLNIIIKKIKKKLNLFVACVLFNQTKKMFISACC